MSHSNDGLWVRIWVQLCLWHFSCLSVWTTEGLKKEQQGLSLSEVRSRAVGVCRRWCLVLKGGNEGRALFLSEMDFALQRAGGDLISYRAGGTTSTTQPAAKVLRTLFILYLSWFAEPKLSPRLCLFPAHFVGANEQPAHLIELVFWHLLAN